MVNLDDIAEKFKEKIARAEKEDYFKSNVLEPIILKSFNKQFADVFKNLSLTLNKKVGEDVVNFKLEGKARFAVEGRFHRIIFQKGKTDILEDLVNVDIIPIYIWKGVTKHLGPISFLIKPDTGKIKWDLPADSIEEYAKGLFSKLIEDEDFFL